MGEDAAAILNERVNLAARKRAGAMKSKSAVILVAVLAVIAGAIWFFATRSSAPLAPTPQLAELFGGTKGFSVLQKAEKVEACRLDHTSRQQPTVKEGPLKVSQAIAAELTSALSSHEAYGWNYAKGCIPIWGVRLSFYRDADRIDVLLCFECNMLSVSLNGTTTQYEDFDPIRPQLVRAIKAIFPNDQVLQQLPENR